MENKPSLHKDVYPFPDLPTDFTEAVIPIDKEKGWTSFDVVKKLRGLVRVRKVGHAGTLDPMATGLLICLVGKATKRMNEFMEEKKEYEGTIRLGESTPSYDAETEVIQRIPADHISKEQILEAATSFKGGNSTGPPHVFCLKSGWRASLQKSTKRRGSRKKKKNGQHL